MLSYHNDQAIKDKYIARVRWHREQEHLMQGTGWESNGTTRGCAVGCTLESYDHSRYPIELGIPEWLARLQDAIFEGLPRGEAMAFPEQFLDAIPVGVDLEPALHRVSIRRLDRLIALQRANTGYDATDVVAALEQVRRCHEAAQGGSSCDWASAELAARSAARSAAESARSAARSAAESARSAESAARSAWSARSAAWSAAWSAESSARAAELAAESARSAAWPEWSAAWGRERDDLLAALTLVWSEGEG